MRIISLYSHYYKHIYAKVGTVKHTANTASVDGKSSGWARHARRLIEATKKPGAGLTLVAVIGIALILIVIAFTQLQQDSSSRSESYKNTTGGAGLEATVKYNCAPSSCNYDFNVYIYKDDGQQVSVIRPDKNGKVNLAMAEGNYVMLLGRLFGKSDVFPQEPLALKNGKTLELKLEYK